jgi:predicted polyphosphate/ATP-dependent NAD kinase
MPTDAREPSRLGLIVNPIAGLGGRVGLKGTDGEDVQRRALELGATAGSPSRAARALVRLAPARPALHVLAAAGSMGADLAAARGFEPQVVGEPRQTTSGGDTRRAARAMEREGIDLLLFAGGDGTARDILDAVADRVPVLGIPSGVKMRSGVFAASPEAAADVALQYLERATPDALRDGEVADLEDGSPEQGELAGRLYGTLRVPSASGRVLSAKSSAVASSPAALDAVCDELAGQIRRGGLFILGPGTTTRRILELLELEGSLLGVDVVRDGELLLRDASERDLLDATRDRPATIVVGIVGGQGSLFGRGNQQISAEVIRRAGADSIVIVAGLDKLQALAPSGLHVDTGDPDVDRMLAGYRRVRYAPRMSALLHVAR